MCGICIGGVCVPYEALLPMFLIGLQWTVTILTKIGLKVPRFISKRLGTNFSDKQQEMDDPCGDGIFCFCKRIIRTGHSRTNGDGSVASTAATYDDISDQFSLGEDILLVEQKKEEELKKSVIKFINTPWCMPCNEDSTETWYDVTSG